MRKIKFLFLLLVGVVSMEIVAKENTSSNEITLVVSADGITKKDATDMALRSAVEQAFGAFVSSNTTILNDEMVKDEIATVSSGNIKGYKEIACEQMPDGRFYVTLSATVSVKKLASYAQSKGVEAEFSGSLFAANLKLKEFNKENEEKVLSNLCEVIAKVYPKTFEYELQVGEPTVSGDKVRIPFIVSIYLTPSAKNLERYVYETLKSIKLSWKEKWEYEDMKIPVYPLKYRIKSFLHNSLYESAMFSNKTGIKSLGSLFWQKTSKLETDYTRTDIDFNCCNYLAHYYSFLIVSNNGDVVVNGRSIPKGWDNRENYIKTVIQCETYIPQSEIGRYEGFELKRINMETAQ